MRDVLLGQAYYLRFDAKLWRAQQPYAPLGTLYAASFFALLLQQGAKAGVEPACPQRDIADYGKSSREHDDGERGAPH